MQALPPLLPVAPATYDATNERTFREALTRYFQQQRTDSAVADPSQSASPIAGRLVKAIGGGVLGLTNLTESGTTLTIDDSIVGTRAVSLASTLAVAGATTLGSLSVGGATVLHSTLAVTGNITADADAIIGGLLQVGAAPRASAGDLRFPNNASVRFRNGANSGDVYGIGVTSGDILLLADSGATLTRIGSNVALGATAATTGALRFQNTAQLVWRNAANTANLVGFQVDASNFLYIGDTTNAGTELLAGANGIGFEITSGGGTKWRMQGTTPFDFVPWDNFPSNDNRQSVGTSTTRLKSGFFGTSVVTPVVDTTGVDLVLKRNAVTQLTLAASAATFVGTVQGTRLISTIATGTAPLTVTSTTVVANLHATNSDQLGGTAAVSYALLASPAFTGTPTAPTAAPGTNTTQLATTAFVTAAGGSFAPVGAQYVTLATDATLTNERVLTPESSVLTLTDGGANSSVTLGVAANGITDAKLRQSAGLSVIGRTANTTGNVADLTAGTDGFVLRRSGTALAFGLVDAGLSLTGTLANVTVPAALVSAGTFGSGTGGGDYAFPANVTVTTQVAAGQVGTPSGSTRSILANLGVSVFRGGAQPVFDFFRANTSLSSPSVVINNDTLGAFQYGGYDGSAYVTGASVSGTAKSTWSGTNRESQLEFRTVPNGSTVGQLRLLIGTDGSTSLGASAHAQTYDLYAANVRVASQLISAVATGTAPLSVASTTLVANLHAASADTSTTQAANNNSTSIATTAYVDRASGLASQSVAAPTLTTSTTGVMMGLALIFTPTRGTKAVVLCTGGWANSVLGDGVTLQLRFGTGSAPANGAALTGTAFGSAKTFIEPVATDKGSFALAFPVTGLSIGTPYWFDVSLAAVTGGNASITDVDMLAWESA